jgi:hypothetical protein
MSTTPNLLTGVSFALSAVMLAVSLALAARVMMALQRAYLERPTWTPPRRT